MKRLKFLITALSLALGFAGTCAFAPYVYTPRPVQTFYTAWWGGIYPEYGTADALEQTEGEIPEGEVRVKIRFKYLTFLNREAAGTQGGKLRYRNGEFYE